MSGDAEDLEDVTCQPVKTVSGDAEDLEDVTCQPVKTVSGDAEDLEDVTCQPVKTVSGDAEDLEDVTCQPVKTVSGDAEDLEDVTCQPVKTVSGDAEDLEDVTCQPVKTVSGDAEDLEDVTCQPVKTVSGDAEDLEDVTCQPVKTVSGDAEDLEDVTCQPVEPDVAWDWPDTLDPALLGDTCHLRRLVTLQMITPDLRCPAPKEPDKFPRRLERSWSSGAAFMLDLRPKEPDKVRSQMLVDDRPGCPTMQDGRHFYYASSHSGWMSSSVSTTRVTTQCFDAAAPTSRVNPFIAGSSLRGLRDQIDARYKREDIVPRQLFMMNIGVFTSTIMWTFIRYIYS